VDRSRGEGGKQRTVEKPDVVRGEDVRSATPYVLLAVRVDVVAGAEPGAARRPQHPEQPVRRMDRVVRAWQVQVRGPLRPAHVVARATSDTTCSMTSSRVNGVVSMW
jgi:hypothetical protein